MGKNYAQYKLKGFKGLQLTENAPFKVQKNPYVEAIELNENLTMAVVYLKEGICFQDYRASIEAYLNETIFNLIIRTEIDISCPSWYCECVCDNQKNELSELMGFQEEITVFREEKASSIYNCIFNSSTAMDKHFSTYKYVFNILQNPNLVVQFMSLYQVLLEKANRLAKIKDIDRYGQKKVSDYLRAHKAKYPFVTFQKSRKPSRKWKEDTFTYIRNEIGHCENEEKYDTYVQAGLQVTTKLIKNLLIVLNDILIELPEE